MKTLFELPAIQPLPKQRKPRRKNRTLYSKSENNRRYKLHGKVKKIADIKLEVRKRIIIVPVGLDVDFYPSIQELIYKFKYTAPTEFTPPRLICN